MCACAKRSRSGFRGRRTNPFPMRLKAAAAVVAIVSLLRIGANTEAGGSFVRGNELYAQGNWAQAASCYRESLREGANPSLTYFNMGNCFYQMNVIPKAIGCYQAAVDEAPGFFTAYLNLGVLYQMQEDWPSAIAALEIADALSPDDKQVVLILAVAYRHLKAYGPALRCIERALSLDSTLIDCSFVLFDIYQELDDASAAVECLDRYPDTGKRAAEKYHLLAGVADMRGETEKSAFFYRKEIDLAPESRTGFYNLVNALNKSGHVLLAMETAREALRKFGDYTDLAILAGNMAFDRNYSRDAGEFYQNAYSHGDARGLVGLHNLIRLKKGGQR
jgi:tetratricopeptide (TPR) repeat protein